MKIYDRNDMLPRFWWLFPWSAARELHRIAMASLAWGDEADRALAISSRVMREQSAEIRHLRRQLEDLNEEILRGRAVVPDASPVSLTPNSDAQNPATGHSEAFVECQWVSPEWATDHMLPRKPIHPNRPG